MKCSARDQSLKSAREIVRVKLTLVAVGQQSAAMFSLTLVLVYFTWGQIYALFPATAADYFGTKHATSNYAVLYTAKGTAAILGGWVGALIFERSGSWATGFYGSAVMALVAAGMAVALRGANQAKARALAGMPSAVPAK